MNEAILIIWLAAFTNLQSVSMLRYETIEQCEKAKQAILKDRWVDGYALPKNIHCVSVPK